MIFNIQMRIASRIPNLALIIDPGSNYSVTGNSITPTSNYSGSIQVAFRLDDGFSSSTVFNADINVLSVDDPPEVKNKIDNITVDEDAANTAIDLSATFTDVDNPDSEITKAITREYTQWKDCSLYIQ